jgi:ferric-dicitrate binding protein FerR (iron transport regulator)
VTREAGSPHADESAEWVLGRLQHVRAREELRRLLAGIEHGAPGPIDTFLPAHEHELTRLARRFASLWLSVAGCAATLMPFIWFGARVGWSVTLAQALAALGRRVLYGQDPWSDSWMFGVAFAAAISLVA